jgi:hypothetical protein
LGRYDPDLFAALNNYSPSQADIEVRRLPIQELRTSMVLEEDVSSAGGTILIFKERNRPDREAD